MAQSIFYASKLHKVKVGYTVLLIPAITWTTQIKISKLSYYFKKQQNKQTPKIQTSRHWHYHGFEKPKNGIYINSLKWNYSGNIRFLILIEYLLTLLWKCWHRGMKEY